MKSNYKIAGALIGSFILELGAARMQPGSKHLGQRRKLHRIFEGIIRDTIARRRGARGSRRTSATVHGFLHGLTRFICASVAMPLAIKSAILRVANFSCPSRYPLLLQASC